MKKYKLINRITGEVIICNKVIVDGFDYYVSDDKIHFGYIWNTILEQIETMFKEKTFHDDLKGIIATNNPNIDIPKVIDEVEVLGENHFKKNYPPTITSISTKEEIILDFKEGYNKNKETNHFTEEDVKWFFSKTLELSPKGESHTKLISDDVYRGQVMNELYTYIFKLWEEQKIETIYFN